MKLTGRVIVLDFHEKLQMLRKNRGLTQEELAQALFVSRTAVSKWESGRGYPNIESLKAVASFFSVTVDELLSADQVVTIAEEDSARKQMHVCDVTFGLLDCSGALLFFLPIFGEKAGGTVQTASLLTMQSAALYLKLAYWAIAVGMIAMGIAMLALQNCDKAFWLRYKNYASLLLNGAGVLLFIISPQPYAAALLFAFLAIKALLVLKKR